MVYQDYPISGYLGLLSCFSSAQLKSVQLNPIQPSPFSSHRADAEPFKAAASNFCPVSQARYRVPERIL